MNKSKPLEVREYAINLRKQGYGNLEASRMVEEKFGTKVNVHTILRWYDEQKFGKVACTVTYNRDLSRDENKLNDYKKKQARILYFKRNLKPGSIVQVIKFEQENENDKKRLIPVKVEILGLYNNFILAMFKGCKESFGYDEIHRLIRI